MRKILVLRGGALGDLIVTLPALAALRRTWPEARIELAGNATAAALALDARLIDAAHSQHEARWSALFAAPPLPAGFAAWLGTFDLVLNFWPDPEGALARHFPSGAGRRFLSAPAHPETAPAAAHYCAPLRALGIMPGPLIHRLPGLPQPQPGGLRIAVHPGSGSARKNWPVDRWSTLCAWLRDTLGAELLIVTGEAESAEARTLAHFGHPAHQLPLRILCTQLSPCHLFVGHDSGITHLAAACGVACAVLFGPTDPAMWAPPAPGVRVIRAGPALASISVSDVQHAIADCLARHP